MSHTSTPDLDQLARRRIGARLGWLTHATVYVLVMGGLTAAAYWEGRNPPLGAALGWGLGLAIHGLRVFAAGTGSAWRDRMVESERQRLIARRSV